MFSVSRFLMAGKLSLKMSKTGLLSTSQFFKFRVSNFGAKSKDSGSDKEVDKSKKSVRSGATASDSERTAQQTIKVKTSTQTAKETPQEPQQTQQPQQTSTTQSESNATPSVKVIETVPGNRVSK